MAMSKVAWKYYHKKYDGLKNDMKCKNSIANEHYDISLSVVFDNNYINKWFDLTKNKSAYGAVHYLFHIWRE